MTPDQLITKAFTNFSFKENLGIFVSKDQAERQQSLSYNVDGHNNCFAIEKKSFWFKHRNNIIINCISNFIENNNLFLDVGGGNGHVSSHLIDNGYKNVVLIEPNINGALNAKKNGVKNILCGVLDNNSPNNSIENLGIFDVIEHIEDDNSFAKLLYDILEVDGYIVVTVPAFNFLWSFHDVQAGHYRRYTRKSIKNLFKKQGFEIAYCSYFFSILALPNFLIRSIPFRLGFSRKYNDAEVKEKQHIIKDSKLNRIFNFFWNIELKRISKLKNIFFGNSIILIGKKKL